MQSLAPPLISLCNSQRGRGRDGNGVKAKPFDQVGHFRGHTSPTRDNESFRNCCCGNQNVGFGFERVDAGVSFGFRENNRHESRGIDRDHFGSPSSP